MLNRNAEFCKLCSNLINVNFNRLKLCECRHLRKVKQLANVPAVSTWFFWIKYLCITVEEFAYECTSTRTSLQYLKITLYIYTGNVFHLLWLPQSVISQIPLNKIIRIHMYVITKIFFVREYIILWYIYIFYKLMKLV